VDRTGGDPCLLKTASDPVGSVLGTSEDEHHVQLVVLQKMKQETRLQMLGNFVD